MKYLITGSSGFIGYHLSHKLLSLGHTVIGVDNENSYYDIKLKESRRLQLVKFSHFTFCHGDISDGIFLKELFTKYEFDAVINLAAQAGVRYSIENPSTYIQSNIVGFANLIEHVRLSNCKKLIYASSSSVYGNANELPVDTNGNTDQPISLYAATKKSDELIAHAYSHLFGITTIGLRFFTVYGPWGRPDMAYFKFSDKLIHGLPITIYGDGEQKRDFTYIDDIVDGIIKSIYLETDINYHIFNLGNGNPITVNKMLEHLQNAASKKFTIQYEPIQAGDVDNTWADITNSEKLLGRSPKIDHKVGFGKFVEWFKRYLTPHLQDSDQITSDASDVQIR